MADRPSTWTPLFGDWTWGEERTRSGAIVDVAPTDANVTVLRPDRARTIGLNGVAEISVGPAYSPWIRFLHFIVVSKEGVNVLSMQIGTLESEKAFRIAVGIGVVLLAAEDFVFPGQIEEWGNPDATPSGSGTPYGVPLTGSSMSPRPPSIPRRPSWIAAQARPAAVPPAQCRRPAPGC